MDFILRLSVFATRVVFQHHLISNGVGVGEASSILAFVVLEDKLLLVFLYILPVSLERHVEEGIVSKHELCRCCACGGMH